MHTKGLIFAGLVAALALTTAPSAINAQTTSASDAAQGTQTRMPHHNGKADAKMMKHDGQHMKRMQQHRKRLIQEIRSCFESAAGATGKDGKSTDSAAPTSPSQMREQMTKQMETCLTQVTDKMHKKASGMHNGGKHDGSMMGKGGAGADHHKK